MNDIEMLYANEAFIDKKKIIYNIKAFIISIRKLIDRFIYTLRNLGTYYIPKDVNECILKLHAKCSSVIEEAATSSDYDRNKLSTVTFTNEYTNLFHKWSKNDFSKNDYIKVDTHKIVSIMKLLNKNLEMHEKLLLKYEYNDSISEEIMKVSDFYKNAFAIDLAILNKYFTFGKDSNGVEIIPLGVNVEATPELII